MAKEISKPKVNEFGQSELDKAEKQFDQFNEQVKDATSSVPAPQRMDLSRTKNDQLQKPLSQNQITGCKDVYLKPKHSIGCRNKFNERFRDSWNFDKQLVAFIAEHKELVGESIDIWTKPYAGVPAEEWIVPVNTPVWGPRYLAEQIKRKYYNRLTLDESKAVSQDGTGTIYGRIVAEEQRQRLDCHPVNKGRTSVFMGAE